ncbi:S41 family peptidase [Gilvimarinus xylanilyticus]|uniref:S41 family peptidase n=1 Tax=Gilvimarinus xylanilyticus TaxID=2944139 RepID=A0A9X2KVC6_9GAMM|nr:S41 family peptidase [Gilvimarinus xylanilyticus]MCP8900808.1 S41 family peptidase [Gilvimarinus xylanilyticus]
MTSSLAKHALLATTITLAACGGNGGDTTLERVQDYYGINDPDPYTPPPRSSASSAASSSVASSSSSVSSRSSSSTSSVGDGYTWVEGVYPPQENFWDKCENPRQGIAPYTGEPYPDTAGSYVDENVFLRSFSNNYYLWYDEITDRNPASFDTTDYFDLLKTDALTPSGNLKDQFHWYAETDSYRERTESGVSVGYGVQWALTSSLPPREAVVVYSEPDSSAGQANLTRGARVLEIDGVDLVNDNTEAGVNTLNAGLFPTESGESHTFVVQDLDSDTTREITLTAGPVSIAAVNQTDIIDTPTGLVGYMLFNSHIATAEAELVEAVSDMRDAGVSDLVLDLRYNGGGYLDIASQLSYMIAGSNSAGKTFANTEFNDKHPTHDPFTGQPLDPIEFHATTRDFSLAPGQALPSLDLNRVFVLGGGNTCSASEAIINGLRGIDVEVVLVGGATCGKPYGAYVIDNCGLSYFTTQFKSTNAKGFGDYADGFFPGAAASTNQAELPGCSVEDDLNHALGDPDEARLAAALHYRNTGQCPVASSKPALEGAQKTGTHKRDARIVQPPGMGDMLLRHPL